MDSGQRGNFAMERRLRALNPELHRRYTAVVFGLQHYLSRYQLLFPEFTDHSELHALTVIDFCNRLLGDQVNRLNADELYVLLAGCYLHDTGMGITMDLYREFAGRIDFGDFFASHSREDFPDLVREFHQEFSGLFIRKFASLLDVPSAAHTQAIVQVARGHRRTDLMDPAEYPADFPVPGGNTVCLPYLAALIRLADEVDVAASRNPVLLYDIGSMTDEKQIIFSRINQAIKKLEMTEKAFILHVDSTDPEILKRIRILMQKMQQTLDTCRKTVLERTPYVITQECVRMEQTAESGKEGNV